jgi:hypothetical protein
MVPQSVPELIASSAFSQASKEKLLGISPYLALPAVKARNIVSFEIISGLRTPDEQKRLFALKKTKTLQSKHLDGKAFDFVPVVDGVMLFDTAEVIGKLQTKFGVTSPTNVTNWIYSTYSYIAGIIIGIAEATGIKLISGINWNGDKIILFDQKFQDFGHIELVKP